MWLVRAPSRHVPPPLGDPLAIGLRLACVSLSLFLLLVYLASANLQGS